MGGAPNLVEGTNGGEGSAVRFDGLTEDWRLTGTMHVEGRLSDALNRRETISISDVEWAPIDGSAPLTPGRLKSVDPFPDRARWADTLRIHRRGESRAQGPKEPYQVAWRAPFRIAKRSTSFPSMDAKELMEQAAEMFVP
jgi:hypothetical protein